MTDSRIVETIRLVAPGTSWRGLCPVCDGGRSREVTFSVTVEGSGLAKYFCHRNSCGVRGVYAVAGGSSPAPRTFTPRPLQAAYRLPYPGDWWHGYLHSRGIGNELPTKWAARLGLRVLTRDPATCVWIITDAEGRELGHQTRSATKVVQTFREVDRPWYFFNGSRELGPLWIVEDCMSAALLTQPAVALMGTYMSNEVLAEVVRQFRGRSTVVALDPDAMQTERILRDRLLTAGQPVWVCGLSCDVKDMRPDERAQLQARMRLRCQS